MYRIREVDGNDDSIAVDIGDIHTLTFATSAPKPDVTEGFWWLVFAGQEPIAFAGLIPSTLYARCGYYIRVGVLPAHRGRGLQARLTRVLERRARRLGWSRIVSDTTDNVASANNFIRAGYRLFDPETPWAFPHSLYWSKDL